MAAPLEIPLTLIGQNGGFVGIAPAARYDRLPASHTVAIDNILLDKLHQSLAQWMIAPANPVANLRNLLQQIGGNIFAPTNETLTRLLKLDDQTLGQWRRILIYTDSDASTIPVEVLWSGEQFNGNALGFVAANPAPRVSFVRHLGLESDGPLELQKHEPLRMLLIFSNPRKQNLKLGNVEVSENVITFDNCLEAERQALDAQLGDMVRLGLLEIKFLVGDEMANTVYEGVVRAKKDCICWQIEQKHRRELGDCVIEMLNQSLSTRVPSATPVDKNRERKQSHWHILHYFGHGARNANSELLLRPGANNLSCQDLGAKVTHMPRIVVLNACDSAAPNAAVAPILTGFATLFLLRGTVVLVCMQALVTPETATLTTSMFYQYLTRSLFTDQRATEEALYEVRQEINKPHPRYDFFCPVLYARPVQGPIFRYRDARLETWQLFQERRVPFNPLKLLHIASWGRKWRG